MSVNAGMTFFKTGDFEAAAEQFHHATKENDKDHIAWNALGICLSKTGKYEDANICFLNAIKINPESETYKNNKAVNDKKRVIQEEPLSFENESIVEQKLQKKANPQKIINNNIVTESHNNTAQKSELTEIKATKIFWGLFALGIIILFIPLENFQLGFPFILYILLTAYLVYEDAKQIGTGNPNAQESTMKWSPSTWGVAVFLLWIIFMPFYAYKRDKWCSDLNKI